MLDKVKLLGLVKFAGDEKRAEEFVQGFEFAVTKMASLQDKHTELKIQELEHKLKNVYPREPEDLAADHSYKNLQIDDLQYKLKTSYPAEQDHKNLQIEDLKHKTNVANPLDISHKNLQVQDLQNKINSNDLERQHKALQIENLQHQNSLSHDLYSGFMSNVGKGLGAAAIGVGAIGVTAAVRGISNTIQRRKFLESLQKAISTNRLLRETEKDKVINYAETIFKFAPNVASDPNLLSSVLANAIHGDGIDPMTIRTLTDLEGRYTENVSTGAFTPKTFV